MELPSRVQFKIATINFTADQSALDDFFLARLAQQGEAGSICNCSAKVVEALLGGDGTPEFRAEPARVLNVGGSAALPAPRKQGKAIHLDSTHLLS